MLLLKEIATKDEIREAMVEAQQLLDDNIAEALRQAERIQDHTEPSRRNRQTELSRDIASRDRGNRSFDWSSMCRRSTFSTRTSRSLSGSSTVCSGIRRS